MPTSAKEIIQLHRAQQYEPLLRGVHGSYLFDIEHVCLAFQEVGDVRMCLREGSLMCRVAQAQNISAKANALHDVHKGAGAKYRESKRMLLTGD
jgi:hypothetical protein